MTRKNQDNNTKTDAIIYLRVSTEEQVDNFSLDTQEDLCRKEAIRKGYRVVKVFREEGKSAGEELKKEGYAQAKALENQGGNVFVKKANEEAAKKLRSETDKKVKDLNKETEKKALAVEAEGIKKADSILAKKK